MVVDGPPQHVHQLARYPALPMLYERLSTDAVVFLDDAARKNEQAIIRRWKQEFQDFEVSEIRTEKGVAALRRQR